MKEICIGILLVSTIIFGGLCLDQNGKERKAEATITGLRQNITNLEIELEKEGRQAAELKQRLRDTASEADARSAEATQLQQENAKAREQAQAEAEAKARQAKADAKSANPFGDMLQKPEVKEMVKAQQKMVFSGMIDKNYAELFNSLGLSPEQSASLKDLIMKKLLVNSTIGVSLLGSDVDAAKRKELMDQAKTETDGLNDQIRQFLGDDNYKQFQSYEKSQPERMGVGMFRDQLASGPNALTPDQESSLIQVLSEERQNFKFTTDFSDRSKMGEDWATMFTDDKLAQYRKEQNQLDERYLTRVQGILAPEQLTSFKSFLSSQSDMQEAGMKMAAKMFAPAKPAAN